MHERSSSPARDAHFRLPFDFFGRTSNRRPDCSREHRGDQKACSSSSMHLLRVHLWASDAALAINTAAPFALTSPSPLQRVRS